MSTEEDNVTSMRNLVFRCTWLRSQLARVRDAMSEVRDAISSEVSAYQVVAIRRKLDREIEGIDRTFDLIREAEG
jgi:hypothetical protein